MATIEDDITAAEAARIIGVSHSQVNRYVTDGSLPYRWHGNRLVIKRIDAEEFKRPPRGNPNCLAD